MLIKNLFIFVLACTVALPCFAKGAKKVKAKNYKNVPLTFDLNYYSSLKPANRVKYLTHLQELVSRSSKYNEKLGGGKKSASLWLDLVLPTADAEVTCFNGGLAYTAASRSACLPLPTSLQGVAGTLTGCSGANQVRCSLAFGLGDGNTALCYDQANAKSGTSKCEELASSSGSIQRLNREIDRCLPLLPSNLGCKKLTEALKGDTQSDVYKNYCSANAGKSWCQKTQTAIASLNPYGGGGETTPPTLPGDGQSCSESDAELYNSTLGSSLSGTPNPKWQKMLEMSVNACGGPGVLSLDTQKDKFGMCLTGSAGVNVNGDIASNGHLERAITEVMNPAYGDASTRNSPDSVKAFQEYFGMSPRDFTSAFCAGSTSDFYLKLKNMPALVGVSDKFRAGDLFGALVNDPKLSDRVAAMPGGTFKDAVSGLVPLQTAKVASETAFRNADNACKAEKAAVAAGTGSYSGICMQVDGLRAQMVSATQPYNDKLKSVKSTFEDVLGSFVSTPESKREEQLKTMKSLLGDANARHLEARLMEDRAFNTRGSAVSPKAIAARKELTQCLDSAIKITEGPNHGADVFTPNTNSGQNCSRVYVENLLAGGFSGKVRVRMLGNGPTDTNPLANQCFVSNAEIVTRNITIPGCKKAIKGSNKKYPDQQICVDDPSKVEVYAMKCQAVSNGPIIQDTGDGPER